VVAPQAVGFEQHVRGCGDAAAAISGMALLTGRALVAVDPRSDWGWILEPMPDMRQTEGIPL